MTHGWEHASGERLLAAKGAPEAILQLCRLDDATAQSILQAVTAMAADGLRVLAVARATLDGATWPPTQQAVTFQFLGLIGLADPIRPDVPAAIDQCRTAGIRVVMMTGDYPATASAIARRIGLEPAKRVMTGAEIDAADDAQLREHARTINIFARLAPRQKLRLVGALKTNGEIVAMTGDGVNDAPALKAAHIGVAMGSRGTDVAREAAALVLVEDDFAALVQAVRAGRQIFDNLRKAMAYIFAIHVPIAGIALAPVMFHWPLVLLPVHVVFLELIIDPACSIVFEAEPEERDVMRRPPRDPSEPLFGREAIALSVLQGAGVLVAVLLVFTLSLARGYDESAVRAMAFATLVVANLGLIHVNRAWAGPALARMRNPTRPLLWVTASGLIVLAATLSVPTLQSLFRFGSLGPTELVIAVLAGIVSVLWFLPLRAIRRQAGAGGSAHS
jgi:Ca2+-transporting ATPase